MRCIGIACAVATATWAATPSSAATPPQTVDLDTWDRAVLKKGWSAEVLLDQDAYGPDGQEIGEVEDILIGSDGKIEAVIVETEAFLDIGDVHARVAWDKVSKGPNASSVTVPVTEKSLENQRVDYDNRETPRTWRVEEFIGDTVALEDQRGYGVVDDVIFNDQGEIMSVIAMANYGYGYGVGPYAYPYYGYDYGWEPGYGYYDLPYTTADIADYQPFDYEPEGPFE